VIRKEHPLLFSCIPRTKSNQFEINLRQNS